MFENVPLDIKRIILLHFINKNSDFLNIAVSCKSWHIACCDVKFPVQTAELCFDRCCRYGVRINEKDKFGCPTFVTSACRTASDVEQQWNRDCFPDHIYKLMQSKMDAVEFAVKFLAEHRVKQIKIDMDNEKDTDIETMLKRYPQKIICEELEIINATVKQIMKANENLMVSGFDWDPVFYDFQSSTVVFTCMEGCGLTISDIRKCGKIWEIGSSPLVELKVTRFKCSNDEALERLSDFDHETIRRMRHMVVSGSENIGIVSSAGTVRVAEKFLIFAIKRDEEGSCYFEFEFTRTNPNISLD